MNSNSTRTQTLLHISGYTRLEQIYRGTRTIVYRAVQTETQRPVVIKVLHHDYPSFSELVHFRNQYTVTKNLSIPGIVQPLSLESLGNSYALVMEDLGSISLGEYLQQQPLSLTETLAIAIQLAEILHHLHQHRVIHKDIKPANILIHPDSKQVQLIDFSIASLLPKETQTIQSPNVLEGTLAYLAPEQTGRMNRGMDYRADFYALGVTLYQLLTRKLPFASEDPLELIHCHIAQIAMSAHQVNPDIPSMVAAIVAKLMAKNAEDRYQSAAGLKYDLQHCLIQYKETGAIAEFTLGLRDLSDRFLIPEKLYGRETEVQTLLDAFERVAVGTTELMLVAGFSGIGKTAVINEVHKPIVRQRGYFIKGKFDQFNRNIPFSAFVQAFRDLVGQLLSESDRQLQYWKTQILAALGENAQVIIELIPELERIIGAQPAAPELSGTAAQNRFNLLFHRFIQVFTTPEHPLVMFVDDLQWADSASLNLIQVLMSELQTGCLLLLGAYRDNEVFAAHPLMLTLEGMEKAGATINTITLQPLSYTSLNHLIADTLHAPTSVVQPLTELVMQKTQGNPFFATQFLKALYQDQLITFDPNAGYWQCDIVQVRDAALTDDVVELMAQQLQKLPQATQEILKLAACIGAQFDLNTLAIVSQQSPTEVATMLWKALQEGLILPQSDLYKFYLEETQATQHTPQETLNYRFLHDRVQQAAYSLIPEDQKLATHLTIGRLLLQDTSSADHLFEILNHFNTSIVLVTDPQEQLSLIHLNLLGCKRAKTSTAYGAAVRYASEAMKLLPQNPWQTDYLLTLQLYEAAAEAAYLNTEFDHANTLIQTILHQCDRPLDCIKSYGLLIQVYIAQDEQIKAIETGLKALERLKISLVDNSNWSECLPPIPSDDDLNHQPTMVEPAYLAALQILITITPPVHHVKPDLFPSVVLTMVHLCNSDGYSGLTAYVYGIYGLLLCALIGDLETAYRAGQVSLLLLERYQAHEVETKVKMLFATFVSPCKESGQTTLPLLKKGIEVGLEVGDIEYVSYSIVVHFTHLFLLGEPLELIQQSQQRYLPILEQFKQEHCLEYSQIWLRIADELTASPGDRNFETAILEHFEQTHNHQSLFAFHVAQLIWYYTFADYAIAVKHAVQAIKSQDAAFGILLTSAHTFYYTLALLALISGQQPDEPTLETIISNQEKLKHLADHAPENYLHKFYLVSAEVHRIHGQKTDGIDLYDRAIAGAKANGFIQEEALANELAAKFYLNWGKEKVAAGYMQEAYYCYARWGAKAKVADLETSYPDLLRPILQKTEASTSILSNLATISPKTVSGNISTRNSTSSNNINQALDFAAILKASQALSSNIQLDELLHQLTQIILQNSGGDRCALILLNESGEWQVRAMSTSNKTQLCAEPLTNNPHVPVKLIQYVKNTQEVVVIDNMKTTLPVIGDYLRQHQPKSVLCLPLLNQGHLVGILYLENSLNIRVFTSDRLLILNFLCTQAAISLENARLHAQEREKSYHLEESQKRLQLIIQQAPVAVIEWNTEFEFQVWNPAAEKMFGYSAAEVLGTHFRCIIPEEYHAYVDDVGRAILAERGGSHSINENLTKDGRRIVCEWFNAPMLNLNGEVCGGVSMVLDISDRQRAEAAIQKKSQELEIALQELKQAQLQMVQNEKMASLGNLVAGVAHEVNNPIGFLNGSINNGQDYVQDLLGHLALYQQHYPDPVEAIQDNAEDIDLEFLTQDLPKLLESMQGATNRMKDISTSLRTFSRADTEHKVSANLHDGLNSTLLILKYRLKANEFRPAIAVIQNYGNLPEIQCFPGQLNQVFMNILANAIDMFDEIAQNQSFAAITANPQQITIHTQQVGEQVKISICDNGKGITEEVKTKIFDHLFTTKGVGKGTGLGLAIAHQIIVEKHGGRLEVQSQLGQGSEFCIYLPICGR
jgi:PAS domain S-box-containing protein